MYGEAMQKLNQGLMQDVRPPENSPKRVPEMAAALDALSERIAVLEKEQEILNDRLSVVLRNEPAQATGPAGCAPDFSGCTAVTSSIASATNRINSLIFRTRGLLDLLEL